MAENIVTKKTITVTMPNKEKYTFYVRPMQNDKKQFAGAAEIRTFVAGTSTDTENITENSQYCIYDLIGNKIGTIDYKDNHKAQSLQHGIYILVGKDSKKIFIP